MNFWSESMEKQVADRVQLVLTDPQLRKIFEDFGGQHFRRSSVFHGLAKSLKEWGVGGRTCFEIGTWNGLTAIVLARFFDEVITVDIAKNGIKHRILSHLGVRNVRCIEVADNAEKARLARALKFDFAYLDGDHAHDTQSDWELTRDCGRVLFHEAWPWQKPVWELVHTLPMEELRFNGSGLALWTATKN